MDNLTHSLAGAVLGQMGLKKKTGLGMATLIIAANIPDIDAVAVLLEGQQHLALRRGITHGPVAMLILPLILTGIMIAFDRWQTRRGKRPDDRLPIHKGWLLVLAYIGTLSHPALDWLNSYGIRLLEPFSSQWYYGDSIFIIDVWMWAALIAGVWISRRREKKGNANWKRPAWFSFAAICAYIFANGLITGKAEADTRSIVTAASGEEPDLVVANPMPVTFWRRDLIWQWPDRSGNPGELAYGQGKFDLFGENEGDWGGYTIQNELSRAQVDGVISSSADAKAFLFWARMPVMQVRDGVVRIRDMRFLEIAGDGRFQVIVEPSAEARVKGK